VGPQTELLDALRIMADGGVAQLPVMDGEAVLGVVTREGVLHYVRTLVEVGQVPAARAGRGAEDDGSKTIAARAEPVR
jgi:predicted transcriptional regulator